MKRLGLLLLIIVLLVPLPVGAQLEMNSSNFKITELNFGSDISLSINQDSVPPSIGSQSIVVSELEPRKATIEWTTDKKASSTVMYGTSTAYGFENGSATLGTKHKVTLFGLDPETTYHFKVVSIDAFSSKGESEDKTFTTPADSGINSIKISDISYDRALITWKTGNFTRSRVEYGTGTGYGQSKQTTSTDLSADHTVQLTGLTEGTEYHFRIVAENEKGVALRSADQTFSTIALPKFESVTARTISPNEVELRWVTNTPTTGVVQYRATSGPQTEQETEASVEFATRHSVTLRNLIGDVDYNYAIVASDEQGKQVESGSRGFRTPIDKVAPEVRDLKVSVSRTGDELVLTAKWKTNEPARGEIVYGPKTRADETVNLPGSVSVVTDHSIVATGLKPSTPYGLTAFSTDPAGNRGQAEISFVTPKFNKTILQRIIDIFLSRFGWLSNVVQR